MTPTILLICHATVGRNVVLQLTNQSLVSVNGRGQPFENS